MSAAALGPSAIVRRQLRLTQSFALRLPGLPEGLRDFDQTYQWRDGQHGAGRASYRDFPARSFPSRVRFRTLRASQIRAVNHILSKYSVLSA